MARDLTDTDEAQRFGCGGALGTPVIAYQW